MTAVRVPANTPGGWFNTKLPVFKGDTIRVVATSVPATNPQPWGGGPRIDPDGNRTDNVARSKWQYSIVNTEYFGMLVGSIDTAPVTNFGAGSLYNGVAQGSGELYLAFNDGDRFDDNDGFWDTDVTITPTAVSGIGSLVRVGAVPRCFIKRTYQQHIDQGQSAEAGIDVVTFPEEGQFNSGSYTDPYTRTVAEVQARKVVSLTPGIIINVTTENATTAASGVPFQPGEAKGITTEVLTWYPYSKASGHVPLAFYIVQYTHMFPTNFTFNIAGVGSTAFPSSSSLPTNDAVYGTHLSPNGVYARIQNGSSRTNNITGGPFVDAGTEIGYYAMIGTATVGPHLHIGFPMQFDNTTARVAIDNNGRPRSASAFLSWLGNRGGLRDPEPYVQTCPRS